MHRRELKALLAAYRERWPQESATVARFDAFVDSLPGLLPAFLPGRPRHGLGVDRGEPAHLHFNVRFLVQAEHDRFAVSDESHALAWVPAAELGALTDEEPVLRMARKWLARRTGGGE